MATVRLTMRKTREILRLKWEQRRTHREVARSLDASLGVVTETMQRTAAAGLDWGGIGALDDDALELRLYGPRREPQESRPAPDPRHIHLERKPLAADFG